MEECEDESFTHCIPKYFITQTHPNATLNYVEIPYNNNRMLRNKDLIEHRHAFESTLDEQVESLPRISIRHLEMISFKEASNLSKIDNKDLSIGVHSTKQKKCLNAHSHQQFTLN